MHSIYFESLLFCALYSYSVFKYLTAIRSSPCNITNFLRLYDGGFPFQYNPKDLDPFDKTDLDL